jgi:opacity protein-like surface antigen
MPRAVALAAMLALAQSAVHAADEADAEPSDVKINWTNTIKYGVASRLNGHDAALGSPMASANPNLANLDDGNRNFGKGLITNRIDLLSELDAVHRDGFGVRVSAAGWYDSVYNGNTDNPGFAGGAIPNHFPYSEFPGKTRSLNGRKAEVRDAFVFGKAEVGGMPLTGRLGQHALVWGESLFFANNAIAGGQSAYDISRLLADPTAQAKEFVLPVPQISGQLQLTPDFSLAAYYQFRHRANRTPSVGSYFSISDIVGDGAEMMHTGPNPADIALRDADMKAKNSGQFGLQAKFRAGETDLGLYAIRFHDKDPQQVTRLGAGFNPASYYLTWHEATTAIGASASHSFGDVNLAVEGSIRHNQSLASSGHAADVSGALPFPVPANDNSGNPAYAVGKTAHLNASAIWSLQPSALWREALFIGEVAWNRLLSCTKSCNALDPNATKDALSLRAVFEPTYRQVVPGLDLGVPVGLGYTPNGSRSALGPFGFPAEGGGDFTIGLSGLYQQTWRFNLAYTNFFGKAEPLLDASRSFSYQQSRKDRDFVSFTVRRSF